MGRLAQQPARQPPSQCQRQRGGKMNVVEVQGGHSQVRKRNSGANHYRGVFWG